MRALFLACLPTADGRCDGGLPPAYRSVFGYLWFFLPRASIYVPYLLRMLGFTFPLPFFFPVPLLLDPFFGWLIPHTHYYPHTTLLPFVLPHLPHRLGSFPSPPPLLPFPPRTAFYLPPPPTATMRILVWFFVRLFAPVPHCCCATLRYVRTFPGFGYLRLRLLPFVYYVHVHTFPFGSLRVLPFRHFTTVLRSCYRCARAGCLPYYAPTTTTAITARAVVVRTQLDSVLRLLLCGSRAHLSCSGLPATARTTCPPLWFVRGDYAYGNGSLIGSLRSSLRHTLPPPDCGLLRCVRVRARIYYLTTTIPFPGRLVGTLHHHTLTATVLQFTVPAVVLLPDSGWARQKHACGSSVCCLIFCLYSTTLVVLAASAVGFLPFHAA